MSQIQHQLARDVLSLIRRSPSDRVFTYQTVSADLGREPDHDGRAMAQVCDLLDAAAALKGIPLLALVRVRNRAGCVNPMAWRKGVPEWVRDAVIRKSTRHEFEDADVVAIEEGLDQLAGFGNRRAWKRVVSLLGQEEVLRRITAIGAEGEPRDAIDDLGSDTPQKLPVTTTRYQRDDAVRDRVLVLSKGKCELCGEVGFLKSDGKPYLETHHIIALANEGADKVSNVVALCATHHRQAHFGAERVVIEARLIKIAGSRQHEPQAVRAAEASGVIEQKAVSSTSTLPTTSER